MLQLFTRKLIWTVCSVAALFVWLLVMPDSASAAIGVGVGSGKIQVDDELKPGSVYELPPISVTNTGDETSEYEMAITYHEQQTELEPKNEWFVFTPKTFRLAPKEVQVVKVTLNLPVQTFPGEYFGYLESHPLSVSDNGVTRVGVAAAAKLYFTVVPANVWTGIYYKIVTTWQHFQPWSDRLLILLVLAVTAAVFQRFFKIQINFKGNQKGK